jgi:integrase
MCPAFLVMCHRGGQHARKHSVNKPKQTTSSLSNKPQRKAVDNMPLPSSQQTRRLHLALVTAGGGRLLSVAALDVADHKWYGSRTCKSNVSQLKLAMNTLLEVVGPSRTRTVEEITTEHLKACVHLWRDRDGLSSSTINTRINTLSALGIDCQGVRLSSKSPLKWHLPPDKLEPLLAYLRAKEPPFPRARLMADYVEWVCFTGMRVEEVLRMTWDDVRLDIREEIDPKSKEAILINKSEMTVPGTKSAGAQATLAISLRPALLLWKQRMMVAKAPGAALVFPINYDRLSVDWAHPRAFLGATDNKLATLKSLRRSAARNLTVNGMPTAILKDYLRHSNIATTMGYLRLTGGYSTNEQRRWL